MTSSLSKSSAGSFDVQRRPSETRQEQDLADRRRFTPIETIASLRTMAETQVGAGAAVLASLAFERLSGIRFDPAAFDFPDGIRNERIRETLPDVTVQFARVIADGTNHAFATGHEFIAALDAAAIGSADDLAAAAHQAISAKDTRAADLFLDIGRRYASDHPELTAVALRLTPAAVLPQLSDELIGDEAAFDPASEQARFLAALKASIPEIKPKKQKMPWLAIAAGMLGMLAILTVVGMVIVQAR
jgi:hypothetical protein